MSRCDIEKYDRLPSVYGLIDVDAARAKLSRLLRKRKKIEQKLYKIDEKITQLERYLDGIIAMRKEIEGDEE